MKHVIFRCVAAAAAALVLCATGKAATIDASAFCVDTESFHFDVTVTGDGNELIVRIGADDDPFVTPNERIATNFDTTTGEFTREPPLVPQVQTFGSPPLDRWVDGPIADFELIDLGGHSWRLVGSVPHGPDAFTSGDTVWGISLRSFTSPDAFARDLPVAACEPEEPEEVAVSVPFDSSAPSIDGRLDWGEWRDAARLDIENGFLAFQHDLNRLYVLIDVLDDTGDDPFALGGGDQFWLTFDVNEDGAVTDGVDLRYRLEAGTGNLRHQTFCDDCLFGFDPLAPSTFSSRGEGFNCFFEDGSASILPLACNAHRVWEVAIDLAEIAARSDGSARFGYLIGSLDPFFSENFPSDLNDMGAYGQLTLEGSRLQLSSAGPGAMSPEFEVSQSIQTADNEVDLAAGKPTAVRVWDTANESTVKVFIHGAWGSVDLPGSPLLDVTSLFDSSFSPDDPRDTIVWNSFSRLPEDWAQSARVDFDVEILGLDDSHVTTLSSSVRFAPTAMPVFWTVPIRNEFPDGPFLEADENDIARSERLLRRMVPIRDPEIVRRPMLEVFNVNTSAELKEDLRTYDQETILAWTFGLLLTGSPPFALPDQITGFHATGLASGTNTAGGSSDPVWLGGNGRITWVAENNTSGYVHELNHNLDTDSNGNWGRHSRGCSAPGTDPSWPYGSSGTIQEVGLRWSGAQFRSISSDKPDLMSYCRSGTPDRWMSPYRWQAWLDVFRTDVAAKSFAPAASAKLMHVEDSFYVMGRVFPDGSGELGQVLRQPGLPATSDAVAEVRVRVLDCTDGELAVNGFTPSFIDVEGNPVEFVSFDFVLPAPADSCAIELSRDGVVVDRRELSEHVPVVTLLVPNGGEIWEGHETIAWEAVDQDGDDMSFTLQYSPDGGATWLPVATGIPGNQHDVDTSGLPGSGEALIRILASDGANTGEDVSDGVFTVAMKPPVAEILSPADNGLFDAGEPLVLEGAGRDTFGTNLPPGDLTWAVDGEAVGVGESLTVNVEVGDHVITLVAMGEGGTMGSASVTVTMADLDGTEDGADAALEAVDLSAAGALVAGDRLVCEMTVRSGDLGLVAGSRYACHVDFDDLELEADSGCDADGDGVLTGSYRLGSNGSCSTSDVGMNYRHERRGGRCTGGPGILCSTTEFSATGARDEVCDGAVGGEPALECRIRISNLLETLGEERDAQCTDEPEDCLGGVNEAGDYRAFLFFEAQFRQFGDRVPDTDDGDVPDTPGEVLPLALIR